MIWISTLSGGQLGFHPEVVSSWSTDPSDVDLIKIRIRGATYLALRSHNLDAIRQLSTSSLRTS